MRMRYGVTGAALAVSLMLAGSQAANIPETAQQAGNFSSLLRATETAGLSSYVGSQGPFTIFAPTDAAFAQVPPGELDTLMQPANRTKLRITLGNHLVPGLLTMQDIEHGLGQAHAVSVVAINSMPLVITRENGALTVNGAHIMGPPMRVDNGLVYIVDGVLMPAMPLQPHY